MIAVMSGFAALLLVMAMTFSGKLEAQSRALAGSLQVEVPAKAAKDSTVIAAVTEALRATEGVESVEVLAPNSMEQLLKPWLGDGFSLDSLPVPTLLDVKTAVKDGQSVVNLTALNAKLRAIHSGIAVESRGPWITQMVKLVGLLQGVIFVIAGLLLACVLGMVVLVARTNLKLHFKTVSLLHMFGATDDYILKQFQWNSAELAGRGALIGTLIAGALFTALLILSHRWESPVIPAIAFSWVHVLVFLLVPFFTALIALVATRLTVQSMLGHMH
jgi:cell division protein FtsX